MGTDTFANALLTDWDNAMDAFFQKAERLMRDRNMTPAQVETELGRGYGEDVADSWVEWMDES